MFRFPRTVQYLFKLRGSVMPKVAARVIFIGILAVFVTSVHQDWGFPWMHYHFERLGTEIDAFYGLVGTLLGLLLSFRINFSMGRWQDGMVASRTMLGVAKQMITQCAFIDDAFSPVHGKGHPSRDGPHENAFNREWACMTEIAQPSEEGAPRFRRRTGFDSATSSPSCEDAMRMSDAAGAMLRIRHLTLAVCELTGKHVRYDADLTDLMAKGRFDDITYQVLTTYPLVVSDDNLSQLETASPHEDGFRTATRINLCIMWLREEVIRAFKGGILVDMFVRELNEKVDALAAASNAVIRIGRTPMPFVYAQFTKIVTWSYVLSAPFYLVTVAQNYAPIFAVVMAFLFLGLDEISVQLEEPFGVDETDINLAGDCEFLARETACLVSARFARDFRHAHPLVYAHPVEYKKHASYRPPTAVDGGSFCSNSLCGCCDPSAQQSSPRKSRYGEIYAEMAFSTPSGRKSSTVLTIPEEGGESSPLLNVNSNTARYE